MTNVAENLCELVGRTPLLKLARFGSDLPATLLGKLEAFNPGSSVKDRIGLAMIEAAERNGELTPGGTIIEPTSGNTGIALAWVAAIKGYRLILTMPETMSVERRKVLTALGAEVVLTPGPKGMPGAVQVAEELLASVHGSFMPQQFRNPANPEIHRNTTAREIWEATDGGIDVFVAGVGTGGTISGVGQALKAQKPGLKVIAVEPEDSPVLSGGDAGPHMLQGIGAGFVPEIYDDTVVDEVVTVSTRASVTAARQLAKTEGLLAGISCGAAASAAATVAKRPEHEGARIVAILPDTGERYLSTPLFDQNW
jgi:cysteine synthase A